MSPICFGEPSENVSPAISWISSSSRASDLREIAGEAAEDLPVDQDAALLHAGQHVDQRPLQGLVDRRAALGGEPRLQHLPEPERHVGVLGRIGGGAVDLDPVEGDPGAARAGDLVEADRRVAEMAAESSSMPCEPLAGVEHVGDQHRVVEGADRDAVALQHQPVVFQVLADLEDGPVLQSGFRAASASPTGIWPGTRPPPKRSESPRCWSGT